MEARELDGIRNAFSGSSLIFSTYVFSDIMYMNSCFNCPNQRVSIIDVKHMFIREHNFPPKGQAGQLLQGPERWTSRASSPGQDIHSFRD